MRSRNGLCEPVYTRPENVGSASNVSHVGEMQAARPAEEALKAQR